MCHITCSIELLCAGGHSGPPLRRGLVHAVATLNVGNVTGKKPNRIKSASYAMRGGMWSGRASRRTQVRLTLQNRKPSAGIGNTAKHPRCKRASKGKQPRPGTKKRRIVLIVASWNQSMFQRLMLLHYQIRLDLARGVVLAAEFEWVNWLYMEQHILCFRSIQNDVLCLTRYEQSCKCVTLHVR